MRQRYSIALGFLILIAFGALLLASPWARNEGTWGGWGNAFFTAFSSVCVTGLSVVDIAAEYSRTGQIILLCLVEIGCLGLMTCGTFLLIAIGRRLSLSREFSLMNAYGVEQVQGLRGLICWVVGSMLFFEALGVAAYYVRLDDLYLSVFYSIMSFCNAGFSILPGSLAAFADDPYLVVVSALLTIAGGIGFLVIYNLCTFKFLRRKSGAKGRLSLHSSIVLKFSLGLIVIAFAVFLVSEWNWALKEYAWGQKLWVALYQAVTPRSCGFTVIPLENLRLSTIGLYEGLMFIGGAPGSVAAGIKVTTLAVLVCTILAMCRGESETVISNRVISYDVVRESIVIVVALLILENVVYGLLLATEPNAEASSLRLGFEAISAITTTGLSVGDTTANLSPVGRVVIMCAMFLGRLGALTVVLMIGSRESKRLVRYPSEELVVG